MKLLDMFKKEKSEDLHFENELLEIVRIVSFNDKEVLEQAKACVENTDIFYQTHKESYENRGIDEYENIPDLQWIGCIDLLIENGYAFEFDWKEDKEEYLYGMDQLKAMNQFSLQLKDEWFDEEQELPTMFEITNEKWKKRDCVVGQLDIGGDCYIVFICQRKALSELSALADKIGQSID